MKSRGCRRLNQLIQTLLIIPVLALGLLLVQGFSNEAWATVCRCHLTGSGFLEPHCSGDASFEAHRNHGDPLGLCNGCGDGDSVGIAPDGTDESVAEECDDGDNDTDPNPDPDNPGEFIPDTCDANCMIICQTDEECDDGVFCNGEEFCGEDNSCQAGTPPCNDSLECGGTCDEAANDCFGDEGNPCDDEDGDECTSGKCNSMGACVPMFNMESCNDGDPCTEPDICENGECSGSPKVCPGGDLPCQLGVCDESGDCVIDDRCECKNDGECDDGNPCTDDACNEGSCEYSNNMDSCDDGKFCNGTDTCSGGTCSQHSGNPCTEECNDMCNEATDSCATPSGVSCSDDGNPCTNNACDGEGSCAATNNMADCEEGDLCSVGDVCSEGECLAGGDKDCGDGRTCSEDSCDSATGACFNDVTTCECNTPIDPNCTDTNECTNEGCDVPSGMCFQEPLTNDECLDGVRRPQEAEPQDFTAQGSGLGGSCGLSQNVNSTSIFGAIPIALMVLALLPMGMVRARNRRKD